MTTSDDAPVEWTVSRITRLLRPLKNKCSAFSSHIREHPIGSLTTYGGKRLGEDQELLPLEIPSNVGLRIHFSRDTVQTFELSKRICAIRDYFHDLLSKDKSAVGQNTNPPTLTSLCSVILGAQIPREDGLPEADDTLDAGEILYQAVPPAYRLRTLIMHALHTILESCPANASLYLSLLDVTLERGLYHESEVLLDAILDYAFESSQNNSPRISNPAYRRFLVDLYSNWITRFPSSTFVRLTVGALQRAFSDDVWTSKAVRRLARKLGRYDHSALSIITLGLAEAISTRRSASKPTPSLDGQLREWLHFCGEICMSPIYLASGEMLSLQHPGLLNTIVEHYCSCPHQMGAEGCSGDFSTHVYSDAIVFLYTLWLTSGSRQISADDNLHTQVQQYLPPPSTFAPLCNHLFRTKTLSECEDILVTLSSIITSYDLPRLKASLWACALSHTEEAEIEKIHADKNGSGSVRDFRLWLVDRVDEAETDCFATSQSGLLSTYEALETGDQTSDITSGWLWEASIGCWFRGDARAQNDVPATPKRRKISRDSCPSPHKLVPSKPLFRCSATSMTRNFASEDSVACSLSRHLGEPEELSRDTINTCEVTVPFSSLLSDALSRRASLRIKHHKPIQNGHHDSRGNTFEESEGSDGDSVTGGYDVDHDAGVDHAPSEDNLDLFRIVGTSPLQD